MLKTNTQTILNGWTETTLDDVAYINPVTALIKGTSAKKVAMDNISPFTRKIASFTVSPFNGGMKFVNGDTLVARITPSLENGKTSYVDFLTENEVAFGSTEFIVLREKKETSDSLFLYYLSTSSIFRDIAIKSMTGTSGRQRVQTETIANHKFILPQLKEQKAIAEVLSSFDDKIELLREENKTLEAMAQALFKNWFVDFEFPNKDGKPYKLSGGKMIDSELGEIPDGWRVGNVGDYVEIRGGSTPSTKESRYWDGDINWTTPKDLSAIKNDVFLFNTERKITDDGLEQISSGLLQTDTLLMSSRAPVGYLAISKVPIAINQGYIAFLPDAYFNNYFMYLWLQRNMDTVQGVSGGSTFQEISKSAFKTIQCIVPAESILKNFVNIVSPQFEKIATNIIQIQTLTECRDALLPKLISGDVRIKI